MKTYCFKLYRAKRNKKLHRSINIAGSIYNHLIALHRRYYRLYGRYLHANRLKKHITKLKKLPKYAYWNRLDSQAIQDIAERIDRALSSKKKGSNNRKRARLDLARGHKRIANQRKDFHFKLAKELAEKYATICIEDLNLKAMQREPSPLHQGHAAGTVPVASWVCPGCSAIHDRDENAATNIHRVGTSTLKGEVVRPAPAGKLL